MKITLDRELKVALLEAVKLGEIDTDIFPLKTTERNSMQLSEIAAETVRLQKLNKASLQQEAELMIKFAKDELSTDEYINALTELWQNEIQTKNKL